MKTTMASVLLRAGFIAVVTLVVLNLHAQDVKKADISGVVADTSEETLSNATVMLLKAADSVLVSFGVTGGDGAFEIRNVEAGEYLVKITYIGYAPETRELSIGEASHIDLDTIILQEAPEVLSEVEVTADHIPIQIRKDTIEYNADAFKTQPNAVVEDLLKKLPGVEVDNDGGVKAQGEDVQNVLVDGKEFFGDDPRIATKNLPSDAVNKVKVYDKLSDMAEFSGIDDGDREKTINLELKENRKQGVFGTAQAGYGSDDRYSVKANINRFSKTSQLSFLGLLNNVNEQGFSFQEYISFSGGMRGGRREISIRGGGVPISDGLSNGLVNTLAGGINYNVELGKNLDIRSSYFYNGIDNDLFQDRFRRNFINDNVFETDEEVTQNTDTKGHRLTVNVEFDIDSTQNLELRSSTGLSDGEYISGQSAVTFDPLGMPENTSLTDYTSISDNLNFSGDLYYRKRFGAKRGRTLTANFSLGTGDDEQESLLESLNKFLMTGDSEYLNQRQDQVDDDMDWGGRLSYTEPVGKNKWLEFNYRYQDNTSESIQDVFDVDTLTGQAAFNDDLSTRFERTYTYHQGGTTFRLNGRKSSFSIGVQYQDADLEGFVDQSEQPVRKTFGEWLPNLRYRYEFGQARMMRFDYRTSIGIPSLSQLSPIVDNSDPLRIYIGNPDLEAEYVHRANLHFHSFSQFSFTSIFAMLSGTLTKDRIVTATTINENLTEVQTPVNIDRDWQLSAYSAFGTPLKFLKNRIELNANITYSKSKVFINAVENDVDRWTRRLGVGFTSQNSDVIDYSVGGSWATNTTSYSEDSNVDQDFFTQNYYGDVTINFLKTWKVNTGIDYTIYTGDQFDGNQELPLWKTSISKYILSGRRGEIKLSMFDVLDENRGISRTSELNYLEEIRSNSLGRYVMLSFIYSIKGFGQDDGGGIRVIRRR